MDYDKKISEASVIQKKYLSLGPSICRKIGVSTNKYNPNSGINANAKNFIYAGGKLAGQVIGVLDRKIGYLQLSVVGLRSLFEMSVNAIYIFNHPKVGHKKQHMRRICKELIF